MNNKGFVSSTLIYTFFVFFLLLLVMIISNLANNKILLDRYKRNAKYDIFTANRSDINLHILLEKKLNSGETAAMIGGYTPRRIFEEVNIDNLDITNLKVYSTYCTNNARIIYCRNGNSNECVPNQLKIVAPGPTDCYIYYYKE